MSEQRPTYSVPVTITIPGLPPASGSPNSRAHWSLRHRERKEYMQVVALACLQAGVKDLKLERATVDVELKFALKRRIDVDNLMARCKPIFDALVDMGILVDDSVDHLLPTLRVSVDPLRAPLTVVRIWVMGKLGRQRGSYGGEKCHDL